MYTKVIKYPRKCGAEIIGASILGGASLIGTGASIATNYSNQSYGAEQSEEARKWSTNERLAAQAYNTQERLATQEYNSPTHMVQMYRAAGVNPSLGSATMASAFSSPQSIGPASSGIAAPGNSVVPNIPQLISSGADLVNAMSKSKETEASLPLINQQVQYMLQQTFGQQITNDLLKLEKTLKSSTLPADIKRAFEEVSKLGVEKAMMQQLGKKYEKETELVEAQKKLALATEKLTGEQAIQAQYLTQNWHRNFESMLNLQRAQTAQANSQSQLNSAVTRLTDAKTSREQVQALGDVIENGIKANTFTLQDLGMSEAELKKLQSDYYLDNLKDSKVSMYMDNLFHRLKDYIPSIPIGFIKGVK